MYSPVQSDNGRPSTPKPTTPLSRTAEGLISRDYKFEATGEYTVAGTFKRTGNGGALQVGGGTVVTFNVSEANCSLADAKEVHPENPFKCQCVLGATQTGSDPDSCTFCEKGTFGHVVTFGRVDTMRCRSCPAGATTAQGGKEVAASIKTCQCDDQHQLLFVKQAFPKTHGTCKCVFGGFKRQDSMSCESCKDGEYASLDISRCTECNDPRMRRKTREKWLAAVEVAVETKVAETAAALLKAAVDSAENDDTDQASTTSSAVGKNQANMDIDGVIRKGVFDRCLVATNTHLDCYPCECNEKYYLGFLVDKRKTTRTDDAGDALSPYVEAAVATCIPCPKNADCPAGTRGLPNVIVRPGFWRSSIRSATIYPCRNIPQDLLSGVPDMKINCLGGKTSVCAPIVNDDTKKALDACGKQIALTPESKEYEPDLHRAAVRSFFVNSNASTSSCKPLDVPADWRPDWNPLGTSQTSGCSWLSTKWVNPLGNKWRCLVDQTASPFSTNTTKGFVGTWESVLCGECPLNTGKTTGGASW